MSLSFENAEGSQIHTVHMLPNDIFPYMYVRPRNLIAHLQKNQGVARDDHVLVVQVLAVPLTRKVIVYIPSGHLKNRCQQRVVRKTE